MSEAGEAVLAALTSSEKSVRQVMTDVDRGDLHLSLTSSILSRLVNDGLAIRVRRGVYRRA